MTPDPPTLEQALAAVERDADAAIESLGACLKAAKAAKAAAASGQMRDLEQALESATSLALRPLVEVEDLKAAGGSTSASGSPPASTRRSFWRRPRRRA